MQKEWLQLFPRRTQYLQFVPYLREGGHVLHYVLNLMAMYHEAEIGWWQVAKASSIC